MRTKTFHGMTDSPEYEAFENLETRCNNENYHLYHLYGGRGIRSEYAGFLDFYDDVGSRPSPEHSIDRIDNDGNYRRGNVRWATRAQQCRNRRSNVMLTFAGVTMCLTDWAKAVGMNVGTLLSRHRRGWAVDRMLTEKAYVGKNQSHKED